MTTCAEENPRRLSHGGRLGVFVAIATVLLVVVVVVLVGPARTDEGWYLDPESAQPGGTKALVLLLEGLGAQVEVVEELPLGDHDVALVLEDSLDVASLDSLESWVAEGGTLVVAAPSSSLNPFPATVKAEPEAPRARNCSVAAFSDAETMTGTFEELRADGASVACFGDASEGQVVIGPMGKGVIVAIGGPEPFTNEHIGDEDNAVLAAALLAPRQGMKVAFIGAARVGEGGRTISELLGERMHRAFLQVALGFVVHVLWRARRLGAPLSEPQAVELPASELVRSMGRLLRRGQTRAQVGRLLNDDIRRRLAHRLNLDPGLSAQELAVIAASRTGLAVERFRAVLIPTPLDTDRDLVALGVAIEQIDQEVAHV